MALPVVLAFSALGFVVVTVLLILTSRSAIEKLVGSNILPRVFINFVPVMTSTARVLAVVLVLAGAIQLGVQTGLLSREWIEQYGFSVLLIVLGGIMLFLIGGRSQGR